MTQYTENLSLDEETRNRRGINTFIYRISVAGKEIRLLGKTINPDSVNLKHRALTLELFLTASAGALS